MKRFRIGLTLALALCLSAAPAVSETYRMPGPAVFSEAEEARLQQTEGIKSDPMLNAAFSLLEEGNPFQARYNLITGENVVSRLPYGVPYFWGGRAESHLFAMEPEYIVQEAWQSSPIYYRAGTRYIYGFDCVGLIAWIWDKTQPAALPALDDLFADTIRQIPGPLPPDSPLAGNPAFRLRVGDLLLMEHPGRHIAMYIGTLRMYGYTEEEVPELRNELDSPLLIHCSVNGSIADRFAELIAHGMSKYSVATVTDGGVCVSLLVSSVQAAPEHVFQQMQDTYYYLLPDGTWLTAVSTEDAIRTCWIRIRMDE